MGGFTYKLQRARPLGVLTRLVRGTSAMAAVANESTAPLPPITPDVPGGSQRPRPRQARATALRPSPSLSSAIDYTIF